VEAPACQAQRHYITARRCTVRYSTGAIAVHALVATKDVSNAPTLPSRDTVKIQTVVPGVGETWMEIDEKQPKKIDSMGSTYPGHNQLTIHDDGSRTERRQVAMHTNTLG
jgi:hypothetical protein